MSKRPWKDSKLVIKLPEDILAEYVDDATQLYTSKQDLIRQVLIELKRPRPGGVLATVASPSATSAASTPPVERPTRSGYKGVYAYGKRWEAVTYVNRKRTRLGVYDTPEAAAHAYDAHLIGQAGGDQNAAVNFPGPADEAAATNAPFIEQFASGRQLSDIEWKQWQQQAPNSSAPDAPLSVRPTGSGPPIDASTPLIERPAKSLYRREPEVPTPRPDPEHDPSDDDGLS